MAIPSGSISSKSSYEEAGLETRKQLNSANKKDEGKPHTDWGAMITEPEKLGWQHVKAVMDGIFVQE